MSVEKIADEFSLDLIVMFGARARGQSIRASDTDIAMRSTRNLSRDDELLIAAALDAFFQMSICAIFERRALSSWGLSGRTPR